VSGLVLITFGIATFLKKSTFDKDEPRQKLSKRNYLGFFTKGFLVNTVNPFTFIFWISVISTYVLGRGIDNTEAVLFFGSILFVIVTTDILKVVLAKVIRQKLKANHIDMFSKVAGVVLFIFGVGLLVRAGIF